MAETPDPPETSDETATAAEPAAVSAGASVPTGPAVIAAYVKSLPSSPGVYRMLDTAGDVIYVGKARALKSRVSNYARTGGHTNRIARMIAATATMEFVTVKTEAEALLLEANLIKRFKPRFNVLMRDDKSFPYILISRDHAAPQILKHRGARARKGEYFGPFASAGAVTRTIGMLQRAFLLRSCSDSVYEGRTRPCLLWQIKRCAGPCTGEMALDDYNALVDEAVRFLRGESQSVREMYQRLMHEASDSLEFERAAKFRNRLWALAHVTADQSINAAGIEEADIFAAHEEGGQTCIQVFFIRAGQNWGNRAYYPKADRSIETAEVLASFIAQFYDDKPVPRLVLVSPDMPERELIAEALSTKAERKVEVLAPQRGGKAELVAHALTNAREALARKLAETASQTALLKALAERFGLPHVPARIEVFDNSHISGTNAIGAMIVAGPEGFSKAHYRKFNIKSEAATPGDDYAMMREVLTRRFKRLAGASPSPHSDGTSAEAENSDPGPLPERPDLVLIDGGAGQLAVAREVMTDLGLTDIPLVGVAKGPDRDAGREHFHLPGRLRSLMLEPRDPVLYFVQRLRDEAHRFAIGTHRAKRAKAMGVNPLDDIPGIGPTRRRALLTHFGSAKAVSKAGVEDLKGVPGISAEMAQKIYDFFHERRG
ncbi:MAG: excinuclease ABC subunit UvrC [Hyphomicrobiaceae bacterium]|nr:excinuclease ABC subunit UvrC [Hyphomicrobiaceae bacterium]